MIRLSLALLLCISLYSCSEDKYFKEKFDETLRITNKSSEIVPKLKIYGDIPESKSWVLEDIQSNEQKGLTFNIRRDIKNREGSLRIVAYLNDSDSLTTGIYYTNWQIFGDVIDIEIYDNKTIVLKH